MSTLGTNELSVAEWENFEKNLCWRVIETEIRERDKILMQALRYGDPDWSDDCIRSRINELEYVLTIPQAIMTDIKLSQQNQNKTNNEEGD